MFEAIKNSSAWVPFKIPPTVTKDNPSDTYALSFSDDADSNKNPSQFLQWKKVGIGTFNPHPWQIVLKTEGNGSTEFKVDLNSKVFAGTGTFSNIPVTGLDQWVVKDSGYVMLVGTVLNSEIDELQIVWEDDGSTERAEYDGENMQTYVRTRIGYIYENENGELSVIQEAFSNFTAMTTCYDGKPTICFVQT